MMKFWIPFFNPELQLKDNDFGIRNKLIESWTELKGFLQFKKKKIENDDKTKYNNFYLNSKAKTISMKVLLMTYLNRYIVQLYQTYKNLSEKVQARLLIQL